MKLQVDKLVGAPGSQFRIAARLDARAPSTRLQKALAVAETALQSGMIRVSLEGGDSELTAAIVNSMAREFVRQDMESRSTEAEHTLAFLDQQLPELRKQLDDAGAALQQVPQSRTARSIWARKAACCCNRSSTTRPSCIDLQQQRAEMSQRFTANHPSVAALDAQIARLQGAQTA